MQSNLLLDVIHLWKQIILYSFKSVLMFLLDWSCESMLSAASQIGMLGLLGSFPQISQLRIYDQLDFLVLVGVEVQ